MTDDKGNNVHSYTTFVVVTNNSNFRVENQYISNQTIQLFIKPNSSIGLILQSTSTTAYSVNVPVLISYCPLDCVWLKETLVVVTVRLELIREWKHVI